MEPEELLSPKQVADRGILSLVQQWKERKAGRLGCYRIGRKILYGSRTHIAKFLELCDNPPREEEPEVKDDER